MRGREGCLDIFVPFAHDQNISSASRRPPLQTKPIQIRDFLFFSSASTTLITNGRITEIQPVSSLTKSETRTTKGRKNILPFLMLSYPLSKSMQTCQDMPVAVADNSVTVGPYDIICGRNSTAFNNIGNRRFRVTIALNLKRYMAAKSRQEKTQVILSVLHLLRRDVGARFIKKKGDQFEDLNDAQAREKVAHALRDLSIQKSVSLTSILKKQSSRFSNNHAICSKRHSEILDVLDAAFDIFGESDQYNDDLCLEPIPVYHRFSNNDTWCETASHFAQD